MYKYNIIYFTWYFDAIIVYCGLLLAHENTMQKKYILKISLLFLFFMSQMASFFLLPEYLANVYLCLFIFYLPFITSIYAFTPYSLIKIKNKTHKDLVHQKKTFYYNTIGIKLNTIFNFYWKYKIVLVFLPIVMHIWIAAYFYYFWYKVRCPSHLGNIDEE